MPKKLRIAILMADTPREHTLQLYGDYGRIFTTFFHKAHDSLKSTQNLLLDLELDCTTWDIYQQELYPNPKDIDIVLITGSKADSFNDSIPWIPKLIQFTKYLIYEQDRIKLIGVCFGHQIISRAIGLSIVRNPLGWEYSVDTIKLSLIGKELLTEGKKDELFLHQMHRDIVSCKEEELPSNVQNLGRSGRCEVQGLYWKGRFMTVQGHPEFNEDVMSELLNYRKGVGLFSEEEYEDGMGRRKLEHDGGLVAMGFLRFALEL